MIVNIIEIHRRVHEILQYNKNPPYTIKNRNHDNQNRRESVGKWKRKREKIFFQKKKKTEKRRERENLVRERERKRERGVSEIYLWQFYKQQVLFFLLFCFHDSTRRRRVGPTKQ
jgi:hypothetical protein